MIRTFKALSAITLALAFAACASRDYGQRAYELPPNYRTTMIELNQRAVDLGRLIKSERFDEAEASAQIVLNLAQHAQGYRPNRDLQSVDDYQDFLYAAESMTSLGHWILYYVRQQRQIDAHEALERFVLQYNTVSKRYGPGDSIYLKTGMTGDVELPDAYRSITPGERIYR